MVSSSIWWSVGSQVHRRTQTVTVSRVSPRCLHAHGSESTAPASLNRAVAHLSVEVSLEPVDQREDLKGELSRLVQVAGLPGASSWPMNTRGAVSSARGIRYVFFSWLIRVPIAEPPGRVPRGAVSRWNMRGSATRMTRPHYPPGPGALRHADFDPSTVVSPQLNGIDAGRGSRLSGVLVDQPRAAVGRSGSLSAWLFIDGRGMRTG